MKGADISFHTVDGSEIRRSPVEVGSLKFIPSFTWFYTSQVVQDFFHQQYGSIMLAFFNFVEKDSARRHAFDVERLLPTYQSDQMIRFWVINTCNWGLIWGRYLIPGSWKIYECSQTVFFPTCSANLDICFVINKTISHWLTITGKLLLESIFDSKIHENPLGNHNIHRSYSVFRRYFIMNCTAFWWIYLRIHEYPIVVPQTSH